MANKQTANPFKAVEKNAENSADFTRTAAQAGSEVGLRIEEQVRSQAERLQSAQSRLLTIYAAFMTHWLQRRQTAAQATVEAAQRAMGSNGEPGRLPEIYSAWLQGSMERLAEDMRECQECSTEIVSIMQQTLPVSGEEAGRDRA